MKNKLLLMAVGVMIFSASVAQDGGKPNIIKTNPIGLAFGSFNVTYEHALGQSSSFQVGGNFFSKIFGTEVSGFGIEAGYRYYITNANKPAPEGFYVGPRVGYNSFTEKSTDAKASTIGIGALIGYQWITKVGVTIDLGAGPTYLIATGSDDATTTTFDGFVPNLTFAIGFNF